MDPSRNKNKINNSADIYGLNKPIVKHGFALPSE